jgi:hypothetical protein
MKTKTKPAEAPTDKVSEMLSEELARVRQKDAVCAVVWMQDGTILEPALQEDVLCYSAAKLVADGLNASNSVKARTAVVCTLAIARFLFNECSYVDSRE